MSDTSKIMRKALYIAFFAIITFTFFVCFYADGKLPGSDGFLYAQNLPGQTRNEDIILRILIAKSGDEFAVSAPGGIKFSPDENQGEVMLFASDDHIFKLKDNLIWLKTKEKPELSGGWKEITISPSQADTPIKAGTRRYRGKIKLSVAKKEILVINVIPIEQYLYGVVPEELGSSYIEANKAQAVVARTFALGHLGIFEKYGHDFSSGTSYQVYGGFNEEQPLCNKAVDDTKGLIITSGGKLAKYPLYHSTCGGTTTDNETVFLTNPIPYLRSVVCDDKVEGLKNGFSGDQRPVPITSASPYSGPGMFNDEQATPSPTPAVTDTPAPILTPSPSPTVQNPVIKSTAIMKGNNINFDVEPANCSMSSYYRWEVKWTNDELSKIIDKSYIEDDTGTIKDLVAEKRGPDGRVSILKIVTDKGKFRVRGDEIRPTFQFKGKNGAMRNLYSSRFNIVKTKQDDSVVWIFKGSGWGHGAGMCQFGALGLAKKGCRFEQILKKYYKGIEITDYHKVNGLFATPVKSR
jgi:peptidoglycan hydrolase-like amidase